jgi:hypothetical protein
MRSGVITIFALGILASAGSAQTEAKQEPKAEVRRLESVTWDLISHTLRWTVKKGTEVNGEFIPVAEEHYEIKPDIATMKVDDEKRRFELQEAALLHRLLDTLSTYCAQSVVWWNRDAVASPTVVAAKQEH